MNGFTYKQPAPAWIMVLGVVILVSCLGFIILAIREADGDMTILIPIVGLLLGAVLGAGIARSRLYVSHQGDRLLFGLSPLWRRSIDLEDVTSVERIDTVSPAAFGGVGYRRVPGGKTGLLWKAGPGIVIHTTSNESITIVIDDSEALAADMGRVLAT